MRPRRTRKKTWIRMAMALAAHDRRMLGHEIFCCVTDMMSGNMLKSFCYQNCCYSLVVMYHEKLGFWPRTEVRLVSVSALFIIV